MQRIFSGVRDSIRMSLLSEFGQYTIEALIVHVLSMVFSALENKIAHAATLTLVERLVSGHKHYY